MSLIRFQGCHMGIFGLASWDPPPALPPHVVSRLPPPVLSKQATVPASSKVTPNACQNDRGVRQSNDTSSVYSPGAHAAAMEKNPFWSGNAGTQALPVEEPGPPLGIEKRHEARFSISEATGSQNRTVLNRGMQLNNSSKTEFDADAAKLIRCGRGSQFKPSSGTPPVGSVGPTSRPSAVGSVFQTRENVAEMLTQQNPEFQNGGRLGNGGSGFSGDGWKVVEHVSSLFVNSAARGATQGSVIPEVKGLQAQRVQAVDMMTSCLNPASPEFVPKVDPAVANQVGCRLIAKHNYEANPNSPLGARGELSLRRTEQLVKIGCHPEHNIWWLARNENGEEGYIPSSYVMVLEEKSGLPWLQNRAPEEEAAPSSTQPAKPYRSAYNRSSTNLSISNQFTCEPCGKSFNGPQPYKAHMSSRAHQETLETID